MLKLEAANDTRDYSRESMNEIQRYTEQLQASFERAIAEAERREIQGREWAAKTMELGLQETGAPGTVLKDGKLMQKADAEAELARDKTMAVAAAVFKLEL